ncbi:MXAN_6652 family MXYO-CTERM-anchored protein [Melittangium boletus]|uniref:Transmembrane Gly-Cys-Arg domain-containing protein n=1 Tax=Melittangium boletus DSM 14713 TaxID=1294270 RepID=A0A250IJM9_9BACT|nr:MXAN_6652 family MXYO-CTERM-anchored protein [Melittangium boletus]ATB31367.1 transmembrane Gly-Cys-Arg domain-containing protein [Melittangium boletus DSM 14713]
MRLRSSVVVGVLSVSLLSTSALARSGGITGVSGQAGTTCTRCHAEGATKPTVEFSGPTTVTAGSVNQYAFIIRGGPGIIGGTNLAAGDASALLDILNPVGDALKKSGVELTQTAAKVFDTAGAVPELRFDFSLTAPTTEGSFTLYGAGNSANGDSGRNGDGVAAATLAVTVLAQTGSDAGTEPETDAGTEPETDAGTGNGTDAGTQVDAGTGGETDAGPGGVTDPGVGGDDEGGGCSSTGGAPMLLFALSVAGLIRLRRRGV